MDLPLEVRGLAAGYGKTPIIDQIELSVQPGEIFGLVGLNGAGKTTFIRSILSIGPSIGEIRMFGQQAGPPAARKKTVYLPERFTPSPLLKGWEFLELTVAYYKQSLDREAALAMCSGLDLDSRVLSRSVRGYSKGMGQKLGLIGTLLTGLPFLILDEPMSGLDPRARILLKDRLLDYKKQGNSIFFSSHILSDIEEICDRIAVMHRGRLIFTGTPAELMEANAAPTLERSFLVAIDRADRERTDFPPGR